MINKREEVVISRKENIVKFPKSYEVKKEKKKAVILSQK